MATVMRFAASDVEEGAVPDAGHWIMEENPKATIELVRAFLKKRPIAWSPLQPIATAVQALAVVQGRR
jgi:hypothetical protein